MFFGGSNGFNAFFPENITDDPFVPPVAITSFKIFNKAVPVGAESVLKKAIPYVDSLTLSYKDNVFSFEFVGLSYANSQKNRYRYKLEGLEPSWNEVGSKQRLATYTNLDPGKYVFRVQGSNSDGVWNEAGVSLPILITPPWWGTSWFRAVCAILFMALLWAAYQLRVQQLHHQFEMTLEARVGERTGSRENSMTLCYRNSKDFCRAFKPQFTSCRLARSSLAKYWRLLPIWRLKRSQKAGMPCRVALVYYRGE